MAINAVTRLIILSLTVPERPVSDWKCTPVATMISVVFMALWYLHNGIEDLQVSWKAKQSNVLDKHDAMDIKSCCVNAACEILSYLKTPEPSLGLIGPLNHQCKLWLQSISSIKHTTD
jgi:hypothetical protein